MSEPIPVDRKGSFRAEIREYGLQEKDSGAVGVRIRCHLLECWDSENEAWDDWREHNIEAWGTVWIVKKDGTINNTGVDSLVKNAGWDGELASIVNSTWQPTPCQVSTDENTYKGETTYPISFVNDYDRVPGANVGNVDGDGLKKLQARFGSSLRAVAGNAKRNSPTAVPASPMPKRPTKAAPVSNGSATAVAPPPANADDEIPF